MNVGIVLAVSIGLQLAAAATALWLIRVTQRRLPWVLIASAVTLMAVRRAITAYDHFIREPAYQIDPAAEWTALLVSAFLFAGLLLVIPTFRAMVGVARAHAESRRMFSTLVSNLPGMVYRCRNDPSWTMHFVSDGSVALTGYEPAELIDNRVAAFADLIHPDDRQAVFTEVQAALTRKEPFRLTYRIRTRTGDERWVWEQGRAVLTAGGSVEALEGFISDITDRKRAEEALALSERRSREQLVELSLIYDTAPVGLCILDTELRYVKINQRLAMFNGMPVDDHIGRTPSEVIPELAPLIAPLCRSVIQSGEPVLDVEVSGTTPALPGDPRSFQSSYYPIIVDDAVVGVGAVVQDVTLRRRSEASLRESEARFRTMIQFAPEAITLFDLDSGRFVDANEKALQLLGYTLQEFVRLGPWDVSPPAQPDGRSSHEAALEKLEAVVVEEGRQQVFEWVHQTKSGREVPVEIRLTRLPAAGRRLVRGSLIDISERKRAETLLRRSHEELESRVARRTADLTAANERLRHEIAERQRAELALRASEKQLQAVLDNSTAVVYVKDRQGRYLLINRRYLEIFDMRREQIVGRTDHELHPKEAADAFRKNDLEVLNSGRAVEFEEVAPQTDGLHTYISLKFPLVDPDGQPYAVCGMSTDITERKRTAEELRSAKEAAEAANRARSVFLANVSHEIRTPLTALLGAAEMLDKHDTEKVGERASMILRNGRHLLILIDDLLDLSRAEAGRLAFRTTRCSIEEILADVTAVTGPLHDDPAVDVRIVYDTPVPATISTDPTRLKQALINLVNNALKFTAAGRVWVRVSCEPRESQALLTMCVEDTGIGIATADAQRVFEPFIQAAPSAAGVRGGVGLGLPLARFIARQLGGDLELTRHGPEGCTFTLRISTGPLEESRWITPADVEVPPHLQARSAEPPGHRLPLRLQGRVLVAEDFEDTRALIEQALTACGVSVAAVHDGAAAVDAATRESFDLILMDIRMPGLDGLGATRLLRDRGCLAPIIALTASTTRDDQQRLLDAGFDDLWLKPLTVQALLLGASEYLRSEAGRRGPSNAEMQARFAAAVSDFARGLPARVAAARQMAVRGEGDRAYELLHQLSGACGIHGFEEAGHEAARLQVLASSGRLASHPQELALLERLAREASQAAEVPAATSPDAAE